MKHIKKPILLIIMCVLLLAFSAGAMLSASALTPSYEFSNEYKSSNYYDALVAYELTGDNRYDVISVALTQVGYHEGESDADMDGWNLSGDSNFVEYNRLYGKLDNNEGNGVSYGYHWCAAFVSWCLRQAGIPTSVATTEVSCPRMIKWLQSKDVYFPVSTGYDPIPGDIIFFKSASSNATSTHVGFVVGTEGEFVYTVEGNANNDVSQRKYLLADTYIVGYGVPGYTVKDGTDLLSFPLEDDDPEPGEYYVTASSLNVRAGAGTSYSVLGTVSNGDRVTVTEVDDGWGRIAVGSLKGWVSMSYLNSVDSVIYTVTYNVGEGKYSLTQQRKHPASPLTLCEDIPTREGHTFLGWAKTKNGEVVYQPGDTYTAEENMALYAIWEAVSCTVRFLDYDGTLLHTEVYAYGTRVTEPEIETPRRETDGEYAYEFAGWDHNLTYYLKRDTDYVATYTARELTAEEKAEYEAAQTTEPLPEEGCSSFGASAFTVLGTVLVLTAFIYKKED